MCDSIYFSPFPLEIRHKKQKQEDIAICECSYNANDPESACGERCLNVLTSTECTPGYCRCGEYCKNQVMLCFDLSSSPQHLYHQGLSKRPG